MEKKRPSEAHSLTRDGRERELSGHRNKQTEQDALTNWRRQRRGTCQDTERNRPRRTNILETTERDLSGYGKETDRGTLTSWRRQREGLVRTWKETDQARCTHSLETGEGGTCQGMERSRNKRGTLTNWRRQSKGLVRTQKETDRARCTHSLETAEGVGTCQITERHRPSKAHSLPGDDGGRGLSGHGKKLTERGALTPWRRQREGLVRAWNETETNKVHPQTGDGRGRVSSEH
jgi:hypothetical protein